MSIENIIALLATLGIGGVLGAFINQYFEKQKQTNNHDMKIFDEGNKIFTEENLLFICNLLLSNHSIDDESFSLLTKWCRFFDQIGNQYLDKKIAKENQKLLNDLIQLISFISLNFFTIRGQYSQTQYLRPDWNIDRGDPSPEQESKYRKYAKNLEDLAKSVLKQYSNYRFTIKKILKI